MKFENALKKRKMTLNEGKTVREVKKMTVLGYEIENGRISPDKDRLQPLLGQALASTNGGGGAAGAGGYQELIW